MNQHGTHHPEEPLSEAHVEAVHHAEHHAARHRAPPGLVGNVARLARMLRAHFEGRFLVNGWALVTAAGALLYVVTVPDAIPDVIPFVGLLDDAAVVAAAVGAVESELRRFEAWERS